MVEYFSLRVLVWFWLFLFVCLFFSFKGEHELKFSNFFLHIFCFCLLDVWDFRIVKWGRKSDTRLISPSSPCSRIMGTNSAKHCWLLQLLCPCACLHLYMHAHEAWEQHGYLLICQLCSIVVFPLWSKYVRLHRSNWACTKLMAGEEQGKLSKCKL